MSNTHPDDETNPETAGMHEPARDTGSAAADDDSGAAETGRGTDEFPRVPGAAPASGGGPTGDAAVPLAGGGADAAHSHAEPSHPEPSHPEPSHAEPSHPEPSHAEPSHAESASVAEPASAAPAATHAPATPPLAGVRTEQGWAQSPAPAPIYVQAPIPPREKGNRGAGILIALLATAVYAALFALVVFIIAAANRANAAEATSAFVEFVTRPVYWVPVIFFFLAFTLLITIVNRGGWWAYVLFGFLVAVVVYFSYIGGALLTVQAWTLTPSEAARFVSSVWLNPAAIAAAVVAREVPIWAGAWISRRGRRVTERNAEARREYDRLIAEGPQLTRPS